MYRNFKFEKAVAKLNKAVTENGMNIEAMDSVDVAEIIDDFSNDENPTYSKYYKIKADILIPIEAVED